MSIRKPLPFAVADPFILAVPNDGYYIYGTCEHGDTFPVYHSNDLTSWEKAGALPVHELSPWGVDCFWAPECYLIGGKFYLFYSANWCENPNNDDEIFRIGAAVADSPIGPFVPLNNHPLFDPGYPIIDANVYHEDGRFFLYYSRCCYKHKVNDCEESWIYGVELKPDFSGVIGEPVCLLRPEQPWESRSAASTGRRWNEGSYLFKRGDIYYMTYSANFFGGGDYAVGYATAASPLGPFVKAAENPILEKGNGASGTGHSSMADMGNGQYLIAYHGRTPATGDARVGFLGHAAVSEDGKLYMLD